jgi:Stage II sporulation protein E (SpoIIE)/GAF domain
VGEPITDVSGDAGAAPERRAGAAALGDPGRAAALARIGLTAAPDPEMDAVAERVRRSLGVPVALVSLIEPDRQVCPGAAGPWDGARCTPLSHAISQHVVIGGAPLVIADAREHELTAGGPAVTELGVVAYAGMPLTDQDGHVLGALCAIDTQPRDWSPDALAVLEDLAWGCSLQMRLRLAEHTATTERTRRDELDAVLRRSHGRSRMLLEASQAFTDTVSVQDIQVRAAALVNSGLAPSYVGLVLVGPDGLVHRLRDAAEPLTFADGEGWDGFRWQDSPLPSAEAMRTQRVQAYADRTEFACHNPPAVQAFLRDLGLHAVVVAPLPRDTDPVGALVLGWDRPHRADPLELLSIATIAGFVAQALVRAGRLQNRIAAVHELQQAMLTDLPAVAGLEWAARYQPADVRDNVGGDWYDAIELPAGPGVERAVVVTVGDVVGHNVTASAVMGQVRSMVRQAAWMLADAAPSRLLTAFEDAAAGLGLAAAGTAVLARLSPDPLLTGWWRMQWTNAGHPPPVVISPEGAARVLDVHDAMFGFAALRGMPRHDHTADLPPGTTVLLYSDGLVERSGQDIDTGIARLTSVFAQLADRPPEELVDTLVDRLGRGSADDVVAFAIRIVEPEP